MHRALSILILIGLMIWGFLMLERFNRPSHISEISTRMDDAETAERCAEFRMNDGEDESVWSLGYAGRIKQFIHGCL